MAKYRLIVLSNPVAGKEQEFNEWYNNVHLPDATALVGVKWGRRFPIAQNKPWKYMAEYELECDDIDAWEAYSIAQQKRMAASASFDFSTVVSFFVGSL